MSRNPHSPRWVRLHPPMVLDFDSVTFRRGGNEILRGLDWQVRAGEHWAVVGPNGAGKTSLLRIAAARVHPTSGVARVLGGQLGRVPIRRLHERIALVDPKLARAFHPSAPVREVVLTGSAGTIMLLEDRVDPQRADELIALLEIEHVRDRPFSDCSEGERTRTLLARALMLDPALLLLDEPTAGLDLPGRELVLAAVERLVGAHEELASVTVQHHLEELPASTTHALLLREGAVVAAGPVDEVLDDGPLSACFGVPVRVERAGGRFFALLARASEARAR
jgi:iron complex transport system ATP-binding protein